MLSLAEAFDRLEDSLGTAQAGALTRRLAHVPEAFEWMREPAVLEAVIQAALEGGSPASAALLAAAGSDSIEAPSSLPPALRSRLKALLEAEDPGALGPEDVRLLAGRIMQAEANGGAAALLALLTAGAVDWRGPLAAAWSGLSEPDALVRAMVESSDARHLRTVVSALRAQGTDEQTASALARAVGETPARLIARLVAAGEFELAAAVAADGAESDDEPLLTGLHAGWESGRSQLAEIADAIAAASEHAGDLTSAEDARRQALSLAPSDKRLAAAALGHTRRGEPAKALDLLPQEPSAPTLGFALGSAFLAGGAPERARPLLTGAAKAAIEADTDLEADPALVSHLKALGEIGLACQVMAEVVRRHPTDAPSRLGYAQLLLDTGQADDALAQGTLARSLDPDLTAARRLEADALAELGRASDALNSWKSIADPSTIGDWRKTVDLTLKAGSPDDARTLLEQPPAEVGLVELGLLRARLLVLDGRGREGLASLEAVAAQHPADESAWIGLADLHRSLGQLDLAGETLRRGAQFAPANAALQSELARWLRHQGRPSEALDSASKAVGLDRGLPSAHYEAGAALLELGRAAEAAEHLWQAHRSRPGSSEIRVALARSLEAVGDVSSAKSLVDHLAENAPAQAWLLAGRLALAGDKAGLDPETARQAAGKLLRARRLGAADPDLGLLLGKSFEAAGSPERAIEHYREFIAASPAADARARQAGLRCAACLIAVGQASEGIKQLEGLRSFEGDLIPILEPLAEAYLQASLLSEAVEASQALLRSDNGNRKALGVMTRAARQTGEWTAAAEALQTAARQAPEDALLLADAAEACLRNGEHAASRELVSKSLSAAGDSATHRRLAQALIELDDAGAALTVIRKAVSDLPQDGAAWIEYADIAERAGDRQAVIDALGHAVEITPDDPASHARRAAALWRAGRRAEAIGGWQKAVDLRPDDPGNHLALARALISNGEVQAGLTRFARGLEAHPQDAPLLAEAGLASLAHGSPLEAADLLRSAVDQDPSNTRAALGLAEARLRLGQPDQAEKILRTLPPAALSGPHAGALLAEAALSMGDVEAGKAAIVDARRDEPIDSAERMALGRAELRFGHWKEALTVLTPVLAADETEPLASLAETILRVLEARWLYADVGFATRHAPAPDLPGESLMTWLRGYAEGSDPSHQVTAARLRLVEAPQIDDALAVLSDGVRDDCAGSGDLEALARARLIRGEPDLALEALRRASPDCLGASWRAVLAGVAHLDRGHTAMALRAFDDAAGDAGLRPLSLALAARAHSSDGDPDSAIAALHDAISQWPDEPAWQEDLARLHLEQGDPDAALPHLQTAAELDPEDPEVLLALARTLRQTGHTVEALQAYERLLPHQPSLAEIWAEAGELSLGGGDFRRATTYFDKALALAPSEAAHRVGASRAALAAGQLRQARQHAEAAVSLARDEPQGLLALAEVTARQGDLDQALGLIERASILSADQAPLRSLRSRLLIGAGRPAEAAAELRLHLVQAPADLPALRLLGQALEADGDLAGAAEALEQALRHAPRAADLHVQLARLCRKTGQLDRALGELSQAEAADPLQPGLALEVGLVHEARREFDRALEAYRRAIELEPDAVEPFRRAGAVLKSIKAYAEAGRMLARAADLDPDPKTLQQLAAVRALELVHGGTHSMAVTP